MTLRVLTVVGARPQFIKAAPVSRAMAAHGSLTEVLVHTGQHSDENMSDVFFRELELPPPAHHLGVGGGTHAEMTARMMPGLERLMIHERPDWVLVYGDTNSTLAAALVAAKLQVPIAHVEAGLRSYNKAMPEEVNRVLTDHLSNALYCPTQSSIRNLEREGITKRARFVGDVMFDACLWAQRRDHVPSILEDLGLREGRYAIATVHRAENTDDPTQLERIIRYLILHALNEPVVWPVHPRIAKALPALLPTEHPFLLTSPQSYLEMAVLLHCCREVFTDSGGLQKEAYFYRKPCTTLRSETEWPETVDAGWNRLWSDERYSPRRDISDYGMGDAARLIAEDLGCGC